MADTLNRQPDLLGSITTVHTMGKSMAELKASYVKDPENQGILKSIQQGGSIYTVKDNLVLHQDPAQGAQLYIPPNTGLRRLLLKEYHDTNLSGHMGMDKTYACLSNNYWWLTMRLDVRTT